MVAVTAILILISSVVLANNARFGGAVLLENLAYDIALSIRQAQVYGIAVQRFGTSNFSAGYGMHFDVSNPTNYLLFADAVNPNGLYDCPTPGSQATCELVTSTAIQQGYRIADLCATPAIGSTESCGMTSIDVIFKRPEPDAYISVNGVSGIANPAALNQRARIVLASPRGDKMSVIVEATGQIAVSNTIQ